MPELPEIETIKCDLEDKVLGCVMTDVKVRDDRVLGAMKPSAFAREILNKKIASITRRGKAIIFTLSPAKYLVAQLMMTGQFVFFPDQDRNAPDKHTKVTFILSNGGRLNYNDQRVFGRLSLVDDLKSLKFLQTIGPEPLGKAFNPRSIAKLIKGRKAPIKSLLMNQHVVAGIGNIYASEILFDSHIDPQKPAEALREKEIERLHKATVQVLKTAIHCRGTSMRNYIDTNGQKGGFMERIRVYGRENKKCPVCGTPIAKIVQAGRSTFFCKRCQK